jgi:hypothetical protein
MELLIAHGADVNRGARQYGRSPLEWAIGKSPERVACLLSHGADPSLVTHHVRLERREFGTRYVLLVVLLQRVEIRDDEIHLPIGNHTLRKLRHDSENTFADLQLLRCMGHRLVVDGGADPSLTAGMALIAVAHEQHLSVLCVRAQLKRSGHGHTGARTPARHE